tara:strand:+ start:1066 stop:1176 length:111 start_codon:yes stop_codon:yes gene_type:complete
MRTKSLSPVTGLTEQEVIKQSKEALMNIFRNCISLT